MKKITTLLLVALFVFCIVGCSAIKSNNTTDSLNTTRDTSVTTTELSTETTEEQIKPAPIGIKINKIEENSIGVPELYATFKNNSDKNIIFDFNVECYDAYGEVIKGYGSYDLYSGTYDQALAPGKTTPTDWHWTLNGFELTKTVRISISKYKIGNEDAVKIPYDELVWVYMN